MLCAPVYVCSSNGLIEAVGPADSIESRFKEAVFDKVLDATGMCVLPGKYSLCSHLLCINRMITLVSHGGLMVSMLTLHLHPVSHPFPQYTGAVDRSLKCVVG